MGVSFPETQRVYSLFQGRKRRPGYKVGSDWWATLYFQKKSPGIETIGQTKTAISRKKRREEEGEGEKQTVSWDCQISMIRNGTIMLAFSEVALLLSCFQKKPPLFTFSLK